MQKEHLVRLTYFKHSGKYYSEGEYYSQQENVFEIFSEVRGMLRDRVRPGLVDGPPSEFFVLVDPVGHPEGYPCLVVPDGVYHLEHLGIGRGSQ